MPQTERPGSARAPARALCAVALCVLAAAPARAAEPVRQVPIYVLPYYESAREPGGRPNVLVANEYDSLLASPRVADVARARDQIAADIALLTPLTLMVLAIRLYDVGLRDDAVFWFYAAKNRYYTLAGVADMESPQLAQVGDAMRNFVALAGPVLNGYAFCDIANQQRQQEKALQWVFANPYKALFVPKVPAQPGDRAENLARALAAIRTSVLKERDYLSRPDNVAQLMKQRKETGADQKYCW